MSRHHPVTFKKLISQRGSDFGGKAPDVLEDIGPESDSITRGTFVPSVYAPGATVRHLTQDEKVAQDLKASEEALEVALNFTPTLDTVTTYGHVVILKQAQYSIFSIEKEFGNRQIKFVIGRVL